MSDFIVHVHFIYELSNVSLSTCQQSYIEEYEIYLQFEILHMCLHLIEPIQNEISYLLRHGQIVWQYVLSDIVTIAKRVVQYT